MTLFSHRETYCEPTGRVEVAFSYEEVVVVGLGFWGQFGRGLSDSCYIGNHMTFSSSETEMAIAKSRAEKYLQITGQKLSHPALRKFYQILLVHKHFKLQPGFFACLHFMCQYECLPSILDGCSVFTWDLFE